MCCKTFETLIGTVCMFLWAIVHPRAVASGGASGAQPPHFTFGPPVAAYIQHLKNVDPPSVFGPSFCFLTPPAAKSRRRAWCTPI